MSSFDGARLRSPIDFFLAKGSCVASHYLWLVRLCSVFIEQHPQFGPLERGMASVESVRLTDL